jgi:arylsulfatase A-like enzyme
MAESKSGEGKSPSSTRRAFLKAAGIGAAGLALGGFAAKGEPPVVDKKLPNIVLIFTDDLGYGDISCYNPEAKVVTANVDSLARQGMRFTDAHSASTVCTPSRYSILTGRMCFRTGYRGVFCGTGGPNLIEEGRLTLPGMLRQKGYATAAVGKWHVGLTFLDKDGKRVTKGGVAGVREVDFSRAIPDAPIHRGFDYFYGTASCPTTDFLYAYIEGDRIPVPPTKLLDKSTIPENPYTVDCREGMIAPNYEMDKTDMVFLEKSKRFLQQHVKDNPGKPFFLYHATTAVHFASLTPKEFHGKTQAGPHGDYICAMDWVVGEMLKTLDSLGVADNTIVMFASDNGPEIASVVNMRKDYRHDGARPWRGIKRDDWEGGHRTPFIVRWPGKVRPGSTTAQLTSLTDIMATCASIAGAELPDGAAEDSYDMSPVLLGTQGDKPVRTYMLEQTISLAMSIRRGKWKLLAHKGSGGNDYEKNADLRPYAIAEAEPDSPGQLYDLDADPGERVNIYSKHPDIVRELTERLAEFKSSGRSAPPRPK